MGCCYITSVMTEMPVERPNEPFSLFKTSERDRKSRGKRASRKATANPPANPRYTPRPTDDFWSMSQGRFWGLHVSGIEIAGYMCCEIPGGILMTM